MALVPVEAGVGGTGCEIEHLPRPHAGAIFCFVVTSVTSAQRFKPTICKHKRRREGNNGN